MRVPDANVLIYAIDPSTRHHRPARSWLERWLSGTETVGLAWAALLTVVRLATNPAVFDPPLSPEKALDLIDGWLAQPCATVIHPTDRHPAILRELLEAAGTAGNLTSDAHLAALAIEHGATLSSFDADFRRFSGLRVELLS